MHDAQLLIALCLQARHLAPQPREVCASGPTSAPRCTRLHPAPYPYPHQQALATIGTALLTHLLAPVKSLRHGLDDFKQVR